MKKDVILEALKNAGVELEEDKLKGFVEAIYIANGLDIERYKTQNAELQEKLTQTENDLKTKTDELAKFNVEEIDNLKKFKEDNEASLTELEELKKYKEENELKIKQGKETDALKSFLSDNKFSSDEILLNYIRTKLNPEYDDNSKITNADVLLASLNEKAGSYKISEETGGAKPQTNSSTKSEPQDDFEAGFDSVFKS